MKEKLDTISKIEIFDRVAIANRELRRRFSGGVVFLLLALLGIYAIPGIPELKTVISGGLTIIQIENKLLNSIAGMAFLVSIVFVVGSFIEAIGEALLNFCFKRFNSNQQDYVVKNISEQAGTVVKNLPELVKEGLRNPYGRKFDLAFRYLIHITPVEQKACIHELECRNKNLFNMLSSIFFSSVLVLILSVVFGNQLTLYPPKNEICVNELYDDWYKLSTPILPGGENYFLDERPRRSVDALRDGMSRGDAFAIEEFRMETGRIRERRPFYDEDSELAPLRVNEQIALFIKIDRGIDDCFYSGVSGKTIIFGITIVMLLLVCLGLVYSNTVRNSILNALETISLHSDSLTKQNRKTIRDSNGI